MHLYRHPEKIELPVGLGLVFKVRTAGYVNPRVKAEEAAVDQASLVFIIEKWIFAKCRTTRAATKTGSLAVRADAIQMQTMLRHSIT